MHLTRPRFLTALAITLLASTAALADDRSSKEDSYTFKVVAQGLHRPTGLTIGGSDTIYFTEIPTPGVGGGLNAVKELKLGNGALRTIHQGEPEPTNITIDRAGVLYWTCKSAGAILEQASSPGSTAVPLLTGLKKPSGIAIDRRGRVYFTLIPTPGVAGPNGGTNSVAVVSVSNSTVVTTLHSGEPEPTDIAVSEEGELYWTCKTAGVILTRDEHGQIKPLLTGLNKPVGIAIDDDRLYWTEVPTPGVSGANGGSNKVWCYNLESKKKTLIHSGDPEPTDITVASNGRLYWTCSSAGVIVEAKRN